MRLAISLCLAASLAVAAPALHAQNPEPQPPAKVATCLATTTLDRADHGHRRRSQWTRKQGSHLLPRALPAGHATHPPASHARRQLSSPHPHRRRLDQRGRQARHRFLYEHQIKVSRIPATTWPISGAPTKPHGSDGKPRGKCDRGINSIQAIFDGKQWQVIEIVWQAETPAEPVPEKYLP